MTIKATDRIVVGENDYDGDVHQPLFQGQVGIVTEIKDGNPMVFYIAFDDPRINKFVGEAPNTTWPFYANELEKADA